MNLTQKTAPLGWIYAVVIAAWLLGRLLIFGRFWWLALADDLALFLFLPLMVFLPLALIQRQRLLLLALMLPSAAFVWLFGDLLVPRPTPTASPDTQQITVMSLNKLWSNTDTSRLLSAIAQERPDMIGLQEVTPADMAALGPALVSDYPYSAYQRPHAPGDAHGSALFSRYPIQRVALGRRSSNPDLVADLLVHGRPLTVVVAHLAQSNVLRYPWGQLGAYASKMFRLRHAQVGQLEQQVAERSAPLVILCDCNMSSTSQLYAQLADVADDSFAEVGWGFGNTAKLAFIPLPLMRIDYVWHSDDIQAVSAHVGADAGSDHLPVVVTLRVPSQGAPT
ncbi:hypothetical protein EKD04_024815 [Chloroflexales bacterium ZM16-3]|nr:hypothetical protein [Chloroflexales bacterium ZM16-3]